MKKIGRALLALITTIAIAIAGVAGASSAMADDGFTITINNNTNNHTFAAYQIFTGTVLKETTGEGDAATNTLGDVQWGSGISDAGRLELYKQYVNADATSLPDTSAADVAKGIETIAGTGKDTAGAIALAKLLATDGNLTETRTNSVTENGVTTISGLQPGYYLVKDITENLNAEDDAVANTVLQVLSENVKMTPKGTIPTVDKKVQEDGDWVLNADHQIGEIFPFQVTGTLPADPSRAEYDTYQVKFTDTMSKGLTFVKDDNHPISVKINDTYVANTHYVDSTASVQNEAGEATGETQLTITIEDLKALLKTLTDEGDTVPAITDAITITVQYYARLNENAVVNGGADNNKNSVVLEYSNNPNTTGTGKTTSKDTYVFTWSLPMTKVDGENVDTTLAGAGFELRKTAESKPISFIQTTTTQDGKDNYAYRVATPAEGNNSGNTPTLTTIIKSGADGKFNVSGLDAGTYELKETKAPDGYNTGGPWTIEITSTRGDEETANMLTHSIKLDGDTGTELLIKNNKGSQLPSTGGMGTTILYIVGGILVLAAAAGLTIVLRKRQ